TQLRSICERGLISYPIPGEVPIPWTAVTDIADAALQRLVRRDWHGIECVSVRGPEELSFNQAAAVIEQVLQQPLRYQEISANKYVSALVETGASPEFARSQVEMFSELARGKNLGEPAPVESITLAAWAETELRPLFESFQSPSTDGVFLGASR